MRDIKEILDNLTQFSYEELVKGLIALELQEMSIYPDGNDHYEDIIEDSFQHWLNSDVIRGVLDSNLIEFIEESERRYSEKEQNNISED